MAIFLAKHQESILGVVQVFERIIFKDYPTSMIPENYRGHAIYLNLL